MLIDKCTLILNGTGDASFHYIVTLEDFNNDFSKRKEEFSALMRKVNLNMVGKDFSVQDPQSVKFYFLPTMTKQETYRHLPYRVERLPIYKSETYIYDAFACVGDKFNLKDILVFVELKYSTIGEGILWAEIYYVADCLIPAMIIRPIFVY